MSERDDMTAILSELRAIHLKLDSLDARVRGLRPPKPPKLRSCISFDLWGGRFNDPWTYDQNGQVITFDSNDTDPEDAQVLTDRGLRIETYVNIEFRNRYRSISATVGHTSQAGVLRAFGPRGELIASTSMTTTDDEFETISFSGGGEYVHSLEISGGKEMWLKTLCFEDALIKYLPDEEIIQGWRHLQMSPPNLLAQQIDALAAQLRALEILRRYESERYTAR